jgi:uncharacterized membrane protein
MQSLYNTFLVLHIVGITLMAGATWVDYLAFRKFWPALESDPLRAITLLETNTLCQRLMGFGMLLIIVSGIGMMGIMHGVWGEQTWFRIKFGLLLIIIANGLGLRRVLGTRILRQVSQVSSDATARISLSKLQRSLSLTHAIQMALFIAIFVLSIFKFN